MYYLFYIRPTVKYLVFTTSSSHPLSSPSPPAPNPSQHLNQFCYNIPAILGYGNLFYCVFIFKKESGDSNISSYFLHVENIGASHLNYIWLSTKILGHNFIPWNFVASSLHTLLLLHDHNTHIYVHLPGGSDSKASAYNEGDPGSISGSGKYPGEGNGNPLQYSCLENPMDGEAW